MSAQENYRDGLSHGAAYADVDRAKHAPLGAVADELRAEAIEARDEVPEWRAFKLGIVRGYRNAVRTFERGRWGT